MKSALTRRPWWLKLLAVFLLLLSLSGWLRLGQAIARWDALRQAGVQPGPLYLALTGAVLGLLALPAALLLWRRSRRAPWVTLLLLAAWTIWMWVDRLWVARSSTALANAPFLIGANFILLAGTLFALRRGKDQFQ